MNDADFTGPGLSERARQQRALLEALQRGPVSTLDARAMGIMHPAGRAQDLRALGFSIETEIVTAWDEAHRPHRSGRYRLVASSESGDE